MEILAENAFDRCQKDHKPEELVSFLRIERQAQLLGMSTESLKLEEKAEQCGRFELVFESQIDRLLADGGVEVELDEMYAKSTVPLQLKPSGIHGSCP